MAKTRAQRKAERRRQQAQQGQGGGPPTASPHSRDPQRALRDPVAGAQEDTQLGVSGEVREVEAAMETGQAPPNDNPTSDPYAAAAPSPAPAPSRADVGAPQPETALSDPGREESRSRKEREKEERRKARARELQTGKPATPAAAAAERRRGGALGFFASCWAELKRVQWPDRDTLVQASAVTLIFVVVMASYLGGLDAAFNFLVKQLL